MDDSGQLWSTLTAKPNSFTKKNVAARHIAGNFGNSNPCKRFYIINL